MRGLIESATDDGTSACFGRKTLTQLVPRAGRSLAGQDQVAERAEAEDVELRGLGIRAAELGGQVGTRGFLDVLGERCALPG